DVPLEREADARARAAAHAIDRLVQPLGVDRHAVDREDRVSAPDAGALRRRIVDRRDHLALAALRGHLDADAGIAPGRAAAGLAVLRLAQDLGVGIEPRAHAADGTLEELGIVHRADVVLLAARHDLRKPPGLLPRQAAGIRLRAVRVTDRES